jgi:NDP-sugar pyrophosphorylase family protein
MRAAVVAGGQGTRLRPYTTILPKALLPIGQRPVIEHILRRLSAAGTKRVELLVGNLGELIRVYLTEATNLERELELHWHWETEPQGTAGALRGLRDSQEPLLVINGDVLTTLDFAALRRAHLESGAVLTVATQERRVHIPYGVVDTGGEPLAQRAAIHAAERIVAYHEKPEPSYRVSMGVYMFESAALDYLPSAGPCQFPDLVLTLLAAGEHVAGYHSEAPWFDIGTVSEYEQAVRYFEEHPGAFEP